MPNLVQSLIARARQISARQVRSRSLLSCLGRQRSRPLILEALESRHLLTVSYSIVDLGTLPGGSYSTASDINDNGQIVGGAAAADGNNHAFLYSNGEMFDLGVLPGGNSSTATSINDSGQIVGNSLTSANREHAFFYSGGVMQDLGTLVGAQESYANAINNRGQIVGEASFAISNQFPAVLYTNSQAISLGTLAGPWSSAMAINEKGQIAGGTDTLNNINAFIYQNGVMTDIGTLPGGTYTSATDINNNGQIVGFADIGRGYFVGFLYSGGVLRNLGNVPNGTGGVADAINDAGDVVGYANMNNGALHAFLYTNNTMVDLNSLVDPAQGWVLEGASGINRAGQIVGYGTTPDGQFHGFLLTPLATSHPPQVSGISVAGTTWSSSYLAAMQAAGAGNGTGYAIPSGGDSQMFSLPWNNLNQIQIQFNEDVHVQQSSLEVTGIAGATYTFANFHYDSTTFTATWTLSSNIAADRLTLHLNSLGPNAVTDLSGNALDGEWTDGLTAYPSGNGSSGGDFNFSFNVLPGDFAHQGIVNSQDIAIISASWLKAGYHLGDSNGDGIANQQDLAAVAANWLQTLPSGFATAAVVQTSAASDIATVSSPSVASLSVASMSSVSANQPSWTSSAGVSVPQSTTNVPANPTLVSNRTLPQDMPLFAATVDQVMSGIDDLEPAPRRDLASALIHPRKHRGV